MRSILRSLPAAFRRRGLRIAATLVLRAVLNLAGLAALLPVLTLVLDPAGFEGDGPLATVYVWSGVASPRTFALAVCGAVVGFIVLKCGVNFLLGKSVAEHELPDAEKTQTVYIKEALLLKQALSLCGSMVDAQTRFEAAYFEAVRTMLIRHAPTLGGQCTDWCEALLNGEPVKVENPTARGVFVHPLDVAGCALMLGAEAFRRGEGGIYHIGTDARSICTNRSAAQRLSMRHHGTAQIQKEETDGEAASVLLDGSAARRLCGAVCRLDADQALDLLFEQRKAAREGREAETIRKMARTYLEACRA